jgi:toxin ParE1/3/4
LARVRRTARAEQDLIEIWLFIAEADPAAADKLLDGLDGTFQRLARNPRLGPARPDLAPQLRYFPIGNYLVLYRQMRGGVEIVRVVHGARYLPDLL